jgi:hypothetical protein
MPRLHGAVERIPLTHRRDKLYLKGANGAAPAVTRDAFDLPHHPPDAWLNVLFTAMPRVASEQALWAGVAVRGGGPPRKGKPDEHTARAIYGYRGWWAQPLHTLHIHCCADCESAWYVAHFSVKRCEACAREHQQNQIQASNTLLIARRAEKRAAERTAMTCDWCDKPMTGARLRRYCSASCRQAAYRERQQRPETQ